MNEHIIEIVLTILIAIIGYFLRQKDEKQQESLNDLKTASEKEIALLWQKHDQDAQDLSELRLHIASQHYVKTELDARFDKMELAFSQGFDSLGRKMDKMIDALLHKEI